MGALTRQGQVGVVTEEAPCCAQEAIKQQSVKGLLFYSPDDVTPG